MTRNVNAYVTYTRFRQVRSNHMVNVSDGRLRITFVSLNLMSGVCLHHMGGSTTGHSLRRCVNGICKGKSGTSMSSSSKSLMAPCRSRVFKRSVPLAHYPISLEVIFLFSLCGVSAAKLV